MPISNTTGHFTSLRGLTPTVIDLAPEPVQQAAADYQEQTARVPAARKAVRTAEHAYTAALNGQGDKLPTDLADDLYRAKRAADQTVRDAQTAERELRDTIAQHRQAWATQVRQQIEKDWKRLADLAGRADALAKRTYLAATLSLWLESEAPVERLAPAGLAESIVDVERIRPLLPAERDRRRQEELARQQAAEDDPQPVVLVR